MSQTFCIVSLLVICWAVSAQKETRGVRNIVLVHGAWVDGSGWNGAYRAEVEPMPDNPPDRVPHTGLWKVVIYEDERFVRSEKEYISYFEAKRLKKQLDGMLNIKSNAARK